MNQTATRDAPAVIGIEGEEGRGGGRSTFDEEVNAGHSLNERVDKHPCQEQAPEACKEQFVTQAMVVRYTCVLQAVMRFHVGSGSGDFTTKDKWRGLEG